MVTEEFKFESKYVRVGDAYVCSDSFWDGSPSICDSEKPINLYFLVFTLVLFCLMVVVSFSGSESFVLDHYSIPAEPGARVMNGFTWKYFTVLGFLALSCFCQQDLHYREHRCLQSPCQVPLEVQVGDTALLSPGCPHTVPMLCWVRSCLAPVCQDPLHPAQHPVPAFPELGLALLTTPNQEPIQEGEKLLTARFCRVFPAAGWVSRASPSVQRGVMELLRMISFCLQTAALLCSRDDLFHTPFLPSLVMLSRPRGMGMLVYMEQLVGSKGCE